MNQEEKILEKLGNKLSNKYSKKRIVNEKRLLEKKSILQRVLSVFATILFLCVLLISYLFCGVAVFSRLNYTPISILGYNYLSISSESMVKSGFNKGDRVVVRAVKKDTLQAGDIVAFVLYKDSYETFVEEQSTKVFNADTSLDFDTSLRAMLGIYNNDIKEACKEKSVIVFHEIIGVYEDINGERWFETKGTSNLVKDSYYTNENLVLGVYDNSSQSIFVLGLLDFLSSKAGLIVCLLCPVIILFIFALTFTIKTLQLAFLEYDVVEEKRKLTDDICVKNEVGFNMSKTTKYKVLAQANDEDKLTYLKLLWKDAMAPDSIEKYYVNKIPLLERNRELLRLNRECTEMFHKKKKLNDIAKHYLTEKKRIEDTYGET